VVHAYKLRIIAIEKYACSRKDLGEEVLMCQPTNTIFGRLSLLCVVEIGRRVQAVEDDNATMCQ
jgi:hypothetical protein